MHKMAYELKICAQDVVTYLRQMYKIWRYVKELKVLSSTHNGVVS